MTSNHFHSLNFQGLQKVIVIGLVGAAALTVGVMGGVAVVAVEVMSMALGMYSSV